MKEYILTQESQIFLIQKSGTRLLRTIPGLIEEHWIMGEDFSLPWA